MLPSYLTSQSPTLQGDNRVAEHSSPASPNQVSTTSEHDAPPTPTGDDTSYAAGTIRCHPQSCACALCERPSAETVARQAVADLQSAYALLMRAVARFDQAGLTITADQVVDKSGWIGGLVGSTMRHLNDGDLSCGMWSAYVGDRFYAADSLDGIKSIIRRVVARAG